MAHGINSTDNFGFVGQPAWHGLGVKLPENITAKQAFQQLGIDWDSSLVPMVYHRMTLDGIEEREVEGRKLQIRNDNGGQLGVVGDNYKILQNKELAEFTDLIIDNSDDATLETCATLFGGRQVFSLIAHKKEIDLGGGDTIRPYTLLNNTHGAKGCWHGFPTTVRTVCANTLRLAHRTDGVSSVSYSHTGKDFHKRVEAAVAMLVRSQKGFDRFGEAAVAMIGKKYKKSSIEEYFQSVWEETFGNRYAGNKEAKAKARETMTAEWTTLLDHEWNNVGKMGGTLWAGLNAVTQWSDHNRGYFGGITQDTRRRDSNLFGSSHRLKSNAYDSALALI